jgi:hypothetical protein
MRLFLAILVTVWGAAALWAGMAATLAVRSPASALQIAQHQPRALAELLTAQRDASDGAREAASEALLRSSPMSDLPFAYAGAASLSDGRVEEAISFLDAALVRNPRREATLVWRASAAVASDDTPDALAHLARLVVLDQPRANIYLEAIAALSQRPEGQAWLLSEVLARDPAFASIVRHLNGVHPDLGVLLSLNHADPVAQASLIDRALRERGPSVAFILWISLLPAETGSDFFWPFNPRFESMPALPPFNWSLNERVASLERGRGLVVTYNGRGVQGFVTQTILLRPGYYRFSSELNGDGQERGGGFVWEIRCASADGQVLARTERAGYRDGPGVVDVTFEVPAQGCEGQILTLVGVPGEFPMRARATVSQVAISSVSL